MDLEFDKYCVVGPTPQKRSKVRKSNRKSKNIDEDFTEILLNRYRSASCKVKSSSKTSSEGFIAPRRGSVYHSSEEAKQMNKLDFNQGRLKIEISRSSGIEFSYGIVDSLCSVNEDSDLSTCRSHIASKPEKLSLPCSNTRRESDSSRNSSPKPLFTPIKKMFDPFIKSKSHKSPLNSSNESVNSQGYLHGVLRLENRDGVPFFEFSLKFSEEMLVAKKWKGKEGSNWIYTFHSIKNKRKSSVNGWGLKESKQESSFIGQMQVSCYINSEAHRKKLMMNEFVLYDISHKNDQFDYLASDELNPKLESVAIVVQVPFEKTKSFKLKNGESEIDPVKVSVVVSSGNHGLPLSENSGPSPLLDRWRLGGGCDCGGWDMACPLHVFNNSSILVTKERFHRKNHHLFQLFVQGKKDNSPTLTMMINGDGHYTVDYNSQLSSLQVFAICISILHSIKASSIVSKKMEEEVSPSFIVYPPFSPIARV